MNVYFITQLFKKFGIHKTILIINNYQDCLHCGKNHAELVHFKEQRNKYFALKKL